MFSYVRRNNLALQAPLWKNSAMEPNSSNRMHSSDILPAFAVMSDGLLRTPWDPFWRDRNDISGKTGFASNLKSAAALI